MVTHFLPGYMLISRGYKIMDDKGVFLSNPRAYYTVATNAVFKNAPLRLGLVSDTTSMEYRFWLQLSVS